MITDIISEVLSVIIPVGTFMFLLKKENYDNTNGRTDKGDNADN